MSPPYLRSYDIEAIVRGPVQKMSSSRTSSPVATTFNPSDTAKDGLSFNFVNFKTKKVSGSTSAGSAPADPVYEEIVELKDKVTDLKSNKVL